MSDYLIDGFVLSFVGLALCVIAGAAFALIMPASGAIASASGAFIGCLICAWVIHPLMEKWSNP